MLTLMVATFATLILLSFPLHEKIDRKRICIYITTPPLYLCRKGKVRRILLGRAATVGFIEKYSNGTEGVSMFNDTKVWEK